MGSALRDVPIDYEIGKKYPRDKAKANLTPIKPVEMPLSTPNERKNYQAGSPDHLIDLPARLFIRIVVDRFQYELLLSERSNDRLDQS